MNHRCPLETLTYEAVAEGRVHCTECGRTYLLSSQGWSVHPSPRWES